MEQLDFGAVQPDRDLFHLSPLIVVVSLIGFRGVNLVTRKLIPSTVPERKTWIWTNTAVSLVHAVLTGSWAVSSFFLSSTDATDLISHHSMLSYALVSVSVGYFLWDSIDLIVQGVDRQSAELLGHHATIVCCFGTALVCCRYVGYAVFSLLVEINGTCLHLRKLLQLAGENKDGRLFILVKYANIVTFLLCRILVFLYMTYWQLSNLNRISKAMSVMGTTGMVVVLVMNTVLFRRIMMRDFGIRLF